MRLRLRNQILLPVLAVVLASMVLVAGGMAWRATTLTRRSFERQLAGFVRVLAQPRFPLTPAVLEQMRDLSATDFAVTNLDGNMIATSGPRLAPQTPTQSLPLSDRPVQIGPRIEIDGRAYYHSSMRLDSADEVGDERDLHVLLPAATYDAAWRDALVPPLLVGGLASAATLLVTSWIGIRFEREIARLVAEVKRLATGNFGPVRLPDRDDELRDLAGAIDQTASQLEEYSKQLRHTEQMRITSLLGASLAHELRNAATGCRMAIDLHHEECPLTDDALAVARQQLQLVEARLVRFLQMGRPDAGATRTKHDLSDLIAQAVELVRPMAKHGQVDLQHSRSSQPLPVCVDEVTCVQAIVNLLINGVEAARVPSTANPIRRVHVQVTSDAGFVRLQSADTGLGPPAQIADRLFDPFVTEKPEGAGMGLKVVRDFALAHNGYATWHRVDGETVFTMSLPLAVKD